MGKIDGIRCKIRGNTVGVRDQELVDRFSFVHKRQLILISLTSKDSVYEKDKPDFEKTVTEIALSRGTDPIPSNPVTQPRSGGYGRPCQEDQDCPKDLSCVYDICQEH